jgi:hypothetical protein
MTTVIADAAGEISEALDAIPDLPTHIDPGANIQPPATVLGPPALRWETGLIGPTSARFLIYVIVPADDRAVERLWELVVTVADAIDATSAVVLTADPATYVVGTTSLPCYELVVEVPLNG